MIRVLLEFALVGIVLAILVFFLGEEGTIHQAIFKAVNSAKEAEPQSGQEMPDMATDEQRPRPEVSGTDPKQPPRTRAPNPPQIEQGQDGEQDGSEEGPVPPREVIMPSPLSAHSDRDSVSGSPSTIAREVGLPDSADTDTSEAGREEILNLQETLIIYRRAVSVYDSLLVNSRKRP